MRSALAIGAIQFLIFVAAGTIVGWPSLDYRWYVDDLHLIREFSGDELRLVWRGNWDLDGNETAGYRPVQVLFNHARARMFGETMAAHRLFMIALFSAYLVLIARMARRFGMTSAATTLAGILVFCAKYSCYHFIWMTDGVHVAQGIAFALALLALLRWVDSGRFGWMGISVVPFVLGVLSHEGTIAVAPVIVLLAALYSRRARKLAALQRQLTGYAAVLAIISILALIARQSVLTPQTDPPWTTPKYLAAHFVEIVTLAGWQPLALLPLFIGIFVLLFLGMIRQREGRETACAWLVCSALSATPGIVETRVNLLLFPITFYCLFAAQVLTAYASGRERSFGAIGRVSAAALALVCVAVPARQSRLQQLAWAPGSSGNVETDCDIARGGEWAMFSSPKRREDAMRELARLGLDAASCETLIDASGRVRETLLPPGAFVPPRRFLSR